MKRENQFSNPELSLQLKSQGIQQDSLYYWWFPLAEENYRKTNGSVPIGYSEEPILMTWNVSQDSEHFGNHYKEGCSAFSVAELGEMFPRSICDNDTTGRDEEYHFLQVHTVGGGWSIQYYSFDARLAKHGEVAITEADARGEMLLYLLDNGYIKPEELGTK